LPNIALGATAVKSEGTFYHKTSVCLISTPARIIGFFHIYISITDSEEKSSANMSLNAAVRESSEILWQAILTQMLT
jgi:hypothetical protein